MLSQVAPDGSMPLEVCRSDTTNLCGGPDKGIKGIAYTHWTLLPTTIAAEIFRNEGINVYAGRAGHNLARAYARSAAWMLRPQTFPYYARNHGRLIGVRNATYFLALQRRLPCAAGRAVIGQGHLRMDYAQISLLYSAQ